MTGLEYTQRGFAIYGSLTDNRGHTVRVQESSAANEAHVWIFTTVGTDEGNEPHLTVEQARRLRDMLDAFITHRGKNDAAAGSYAGRVEEAEVAMRRLRDANRELAKDALRAMNRAAKAEAALAELGEPRLEWGVRTRDDDPDEDIEVLSSEAVAREFASTWRSEIPDANPTAMCRTARTVGPWRVADTTPRTAVECGTVEQDVQPVRCGAECDEGHSYEPGSCEAAMDSDQAIAQNHRDAMRDWGIRDKGGDVDE